MRKILKIGFIILIVGFIVIQFFQPKANTSDDNSGLITQQVQMPDDIILMFENACLNCHSNNTNYWWYNKIAPVSWMVNDHITEGKKELNLSEWDEMDIYDKIGVLDDVGKEVSRKTMPLKSYSSVHKEAKLSDEQIEAFVAWTEKYSEELMNSIED
jgi:hypothetical protein